MTPEQIEFHRKRFEEWCKDNGHNTDDLCGNYLNLNTYKAWIVWISAIESIEIPLPTDDGSISQNAYWLDCVAHLKSLGLKVKER